MSRVQRQAQRVQGQIRKLEQRDHSGAEGEIEILTKGFGFTSPNTGEPSEDLNRK